MHNTHKIKFPISQSSVPYQSHYYRSLLLEGRSRDNSVTIPTRYGLDGPGIESPPVQTGSEAQPASCTMGTGCFPGVKRLGRGVDHPPPSRAEVRERVELYLYFTSGPSWPVLERNITFQFYVVGRHIV